MLETFGLKRQATGPPRQATGPPRSGAGVGVGMLRGARDSLISDLCFHFSLLLCVISICLFVVSAFNVFFFLTFVFQKNVGARVFKNVKCQDPQIYKTNMFIKCFHKFS